MSHELQKDEMYLQGDLGEVVIASTGVKAKIIGSQSNNGTVTLTLMEGINYFPEPKTEDADFEIIEPKQITNGK